MLFFIKRVIIDAYLLLNVAKSGCVYFEIINSNVRYFKIAYALFNFNSKSIRNND